MGCGSSTPPPPPPPTLTADFSRQGSTTRATSTRAVPEIEEDEGKLKVKGARAVDRDLLAAAGRGDVEAIRRLCSAGANVNFGREERNLMTPLHEATKKGSVEAVRALLDLGALPDSTEAGGMNPLHLAARGAHLDVAETILNHRSCSAGVVGARDQHGRTPLHYVAMRKNRPFYDLLVRFRADPAAKDKSGASPAELLSR